MTTPVPEGSVVTPAERVADSLLRSMHLLARGKGLSADDILDEREDLVDALDQLIDEALRRTTES